MFARIACVLFLAVNCCSQLAFKYHGQREIEEYFQEFIRRFPNIASVYSIGSSAGNSDLLVMRLSAANDSDMSIPNVKLIANIHGNEPVGREVLLNFIEFLGTSHVRNETVAWLLNNTRIHVLPTMNPDGFAKACIGICVGTKGRDNSRDVDLNRDFPTMSKPNFAGQPETEAIKAWMKNETFVLSASLHSGNFVANYPYDWEREHRSLPKRLPSKTADDDVFRHLASVYSNSHTTMHNKSKFPGGIINGAEWYTIDGSMQDYNYIFHGCMELTLELYSCKYPEPRHLKSLWRENKEALLNYCMLSHMGVKGRIFDANESKPLTTKMSISGRETTFSSNKHGYFWRILLPGSYTLEVEHGNKAYNIPFIVNDMDGPHPKPTILEITFTNQTLSVKSSTERKTTLQVSSTESSSSKPTTTSAVVDSTTLTSPAVVGSAKLEVTESEVMRSGCVCTGNVFLFLFLILFSLLI